MILNLNVYQLVFHSGVHIGTREGALEGTDTVIHSDTLYSAFFNGYRLLYGKQELEKLLELFLTDNTPLLLSSAFPFWKGRHYLPVPKNQIPGDKQSKEYLFCQDSLRADSPSRGAVGGLKTPEGENMLPINSEDMDCANELLEGDQCTRVGLDRRTNHPGDRYFHCSEVHFSKESGLYFLARVQVEKYKRRLDAVFRLLADEGIGGDRTVGKGLFAYPKSEEMKLEVPEKAKGWVSLSLYYPGGGEWKGISESYYDLIQRRGYVFSPDSKSLRRMPVSMFTEGSVFPATPERHGKMVDVTPKILSAHKVYRTGLAIGIPCVMKGAGDENQVETLTPVHIGSGQEISPMEYLVQDVFVRLVFEGLFRDEGFFDYQQAL